MGLILLIILVLLLVGALPTWGYSSSWGYGPTGGLGFILTMKSGKKGLLPSKLVVICKDATYNERRP